jgi:hypothetical protein
MEEHQCDPSDCITTILPHRFVKARNGEAAKTIAEGKNFVGSSSSTTKFEDQNCQKQSFHIEERSINST